MCREDSGGQPSRVVFGLTSRPKTPSISRPPTPPTIVIAGARESVITDRTKYGYPNNTSPQPLLFLSEACHRPVILSCLFFATRQSIPRLHEPWRQDIRTGTGDAQITSRGPLGKEIKLIWTSTQRCWTRASDIASTEQLDLMELLTDSLRGV
ncbi:uncharacterized protein BDZ99DRAFT_514353 [Mytilinidion resinicola]|uniref:Uncharacterized protein n=1 Tax=Mytilinidion resinicola TaxID=574789 RepID=A0A6A6Z4F9_9PEZI|nr:uncharacterized protein BDZ99DRAFT_514353 [Mytilinidion resinicola]KAF2815708.1 hypothetical protein BDZ99DRAFT_514353 [Mytilinidion resinicola]